jgi:hypothetical protein
MYLRLSFCKFLSAIFIACCIMLLGYTAQAQNKQVDIKEMKDTVNSIITKIKAIEKSAPGKQQADDLRTRLTLLVIMNGDKQCGLWPTPSTKIELMEEYWKCTFDNALYGKKFILINQ